MPPSLSCLHLEEVGEELAEAGASRSTVSIRLVTSPEGRVAGVRSSWAGRRGVLERETLLVAKSGTRSIARLLAPGRLHGWESAINPPVRGSETKPKPGGLPWERMRKGGGVMILLGVLVVWLLAAPLTALVVGRAFSRGWKPRPGETAAERSLVELSQV
jgi:hypothetical protein